MWCCTKKKNHLLIALLAWHCSLRHKFVSDFQAGILWGSTFFWSQFSTGFMLFWQNRSLLTHAHRNLKVKLNYFLLCSSIILFQLQSLYWFYLGNKCISTLSVLYWAGWSQHMYLLGCHIDLVGVSCSTNEFLDQCRKWQ